MPIKLQLDRQFRESWDMRLINSVVYAYHSYFWPVMLSIVFGGLGYLIGKWN